MENADSTQSLDTRREAEKSAAPSAADRAVVSGEAAVPAADALLSDEARRQQLEMELKRMGMSPEEVRRLLSAGARTTEAAARPTPAPLSPAEMPSLPATAKKPARMDAASLQSFAAELMQSKAAAQVEAVQKAEVALALPEFREATIQEKLKAEPILRDASMLRRRERYAEALLKCREALDLTPKDAAALELMGDILQGVARIDEALAAYKRATEADPKRASAERKYGDLLMRQQNWGGSADPEDVPKNPFVAVLLSALLPGAGQIYNSELAKGVFLLAADVIIVLLLYLLPPSGGKALSTGQMIVLVIGGILYIAGVADANIIARRNRQNRSSW